MSLSFVWQNDSKFIDKSEKPLEKMQACAPTGTPPGGGGGAFAPFAT